MSKPRVRKTGGFPDFCLSQMLRRLPDSEKTRSVCEPALRSKVNEQAASLENLRFSGLLSEPRRRFDCWQAENAQIKRKRNAGDKE